MLKKKRGRPSNAYKRKVRNLKILGVASIISITFITIVILNNNLKSNNIKGSVSSSSLIKDSNLYKCAINSYNLTTGEGLNYNHKFQKSELYKITSLSCDASVSITTLKGIEYMKKLKEVSINLSDYKGSVVNFKYNKNLKDIIIYNLPSRMSINNIKLPFSQYVYKKDDYQLNIYRAQSINDYTYTGKQLNLYNEIKGLKALNINNNYYDVRKVGTYKIDVVPEYEVYWNDGKLHPMDNPYKWNDGTNSQKTLTFNIKPVDISKLKTKTKIASSTFTGKAQEPKVELYIYNSDKKEYEMLLDDEYTIKYENNINVGSDAKVIITGKGNYIGTIVRNFTIKERKENVNSDVTINANDRLLKAQCGSSSVKFEIKGTDLRDYFSISDSNGTIIKSFINFSKCTNDSCIGYIDKSYNDIYIIVQKTGKNGKEYKFGKYSTCVKKEQSSQNKPSNNNTPTTKTPTTNKTTNTPKKVSTMKINMSKKSDKKGCYGVGVKAKMTAKYKIKSVEVLIDEKQPWKTSNKCTVNNNVAECTIGSKYNKLRYKVTTSNNEYQEFGPFCIN